MSMPQEDPFCGHPSGDALAGGSRPVIEPVNKQSSAPGIDTDGSTRYRSVETPQTRYDTLSSTTTSGRLPLSRPRPFPSRDGRIDLDPGGTVPPGSNPYRPAGDAPTLGYLKGRRSGSGASLRTVVARAVRYGWVRGNPFRPPHRHPWTDSLLSLMPTIGHHLTATTGQRHWQVTSP